MKFRPIYTLLLLTSLGLTLPLAAAKAPVNLDAVPAPLTLDDALTYALAHNPQLRIVRENLRQRQGILVQSVAGMLPSITASATAGDVQNEQMLTGGAAGSNGRKYWNADVTLTQTLFAGGKVVTNVYASNASMQAARARVTSAVESTVYSLKQAFYSVLVSRQIIGVHEENLQVLEEQLKNVDARRQAGVASDFEVLQAKVAVANERPLLIRARNDYRVAAEALMAVLGAPSNADLDPDTVTGELKPEDLSLQLTDLLAASELHRADIRAAHSDTSAARATALSTAGSYLPQVQAFAGYQWQKNVTTTAVHPPVDGWNVGVAASWTIFDGFNREAALYTAISRRRQASATELQTRLAVSVEVRQAFSAFEQAREILTSAQTVVDQARESLRLSKARFAAGSSTQLDVLQAQSALSQARLTLLQAQYDHIISIARLQQATGTHSWKLTIKENV